MLLIIEFALIGIIYANNYLLPPPLREVINAPLEVAHFVAYETVQMFNLSLDEFLRRRLFQPAINSFLKSLQIAMINPTHKRIFV
ncbi:hypothetical protein AQ925_01575 [Burkholderia pseudomallei]|nr:hypothetical protein AQ925_01575 [Burkholderia pseudomallei]OND03207.1 hypothetical protein AQ926_05205 [Burkholderia pseudomallei]OND11032.1 hypothetical protein AQ929_09670 [Burkholderia pseudomallei]OND15261.1 hypothetical protein AQ927_13500 [Burkholderia pseudomallei]OND19737.1 hypothetical protein AQ928_18390 [Burkholderia pseudomallei]